MHGGGGRALRGAALPLVVLLAALLLSSAGCGKKEESVGMKFDVGKPAPEFTLPDLEGNQIELSSMKGKVLILDFWATWCPPCKEEVPHLVSLQSKYRDQGLQIVGLSLDKEGASKVKPPPIRIFPSGWTTITLIGPLAFGSNPSSAD